MGTHHHGNMRLVDPVTQPLLFHRSNMVLKSSFPQPNACRIRADHNAVLAALQPRPEPYQASMADILHDLKNQVVAAVVTRPDRWPKTKPPGWNSNSTHDAILTEHMP